MNEPSLLEALRGLTFTQVSRLLRHANPSVDAAKVRNSPAKGMDDVVTAVLKSYNKPAPREKPVRTEMKQFKALDLSEWNLGEWHVLPCGCKAVFAADSFSL